MKPRKIVMQAFGPYLTETTVDFTKLHGDGLFLITGATGCGKTTILDAMSFALYGRATGSVRDARDMRSIAAPDTLDMRVAFEFELGSALYKFERGIKIREVKRRIGGVDRVPETFESCYAGNGGAWSLICTGPQVREKAAELLGFSHEQFSQVVVLPQGEFRRLLTAPSLEKQKILEMLFGTSRWQAFTRALSEKSKALNVALSECAAHKATLLKSAGCEDAEKLGGRVEQAVAAYGEIEGALKALSGAYAEASAAFSGASELSDKFSQLEACRKRLLELSGEAEAVKEKRKRLDDAEKADRLLPYRAALEGANAAAAETQNAEIAGAQGLAAAERENEAAQREFDGCAGSDEKLRELAAQAARLEGILGPSRALCTAQKELTQKQTELAAAQNNAKKAKAALEATTKDVEELQAQIKRNFEQSVSKLPEYKAEKSTLEAQTLCFSRLHGQEKIAGELETSLTKKREEYKRAAQVLKNEKQALEQMQSALDHDASFRLAQGLRENAPCPVCGSISHPAPAQAAQSAPTREALDTQKQIVSGLEQSLQALYEEGAALRGEAQAAQKRLAELREESALFGPESEITAKLAAASSAADKAQKAADAQKPLEERLKRLEAVLDTAKKQCDAAALARDGAAAAAQKLEGRVAELLSAVPEEFRDADRAAARIAGLKEEYKSTAARAKTARERVEAARSALAAAAERLTSAKSNFAAARQRLEAAQAEYARRAELAGFARDVDAKALTIPSNVRDELRKSIEDYDRETLLQRDKEEQLTRQLAEAQQPDLDALRHDADEKREAAERAATQKGSLEAEIKNLRGITAQIEGIGAREEKLRGDFALYEQIFRLCNGENALKTPIHQFVLGLMLDDIVSCANQHLRELSRGRYALSRSESPGRGGGTKGLDLSVLDAWSGGVRSVSTLSGGEMFLASLSLAFGLSDVVQAYAGGIRLDSLFIDEGFGSLDAETLDTAMGALERLRLSGRLIGVISHVGELRGRIPAHIEVKRLADGSATALVEAS